MKHLFISLFITVFLASEFAAAANPPLPEGNAGIAAQYPRDSGIASNSAVIFADGFENYNVPNDLWNTYFNVFQLNEIRIAQEPGHVFSGSKALEFTLPKGTTELSNGVQMKVSPQRDVLFLRYYSKFDTSFDIVGSCHNGGGISSHYFVGYNSTPGIPADGYNKYLIEFECWRGDTQTANPGHYNIYIYHPLQRDNYGDHFFPDGEVMPNTSLAFDFGPDFISRPNVTPEPGRWYCHEVMLKANTVGLKDGRIACWLDGALIADFQNLELRKADSLTIDRFNVSFHAKSNPVRETRKWYDNIVAATSYIGPMIAGSSVLLQPSRPMRNGFALYTVCDIKGRVVGLYKAGYRGGAFRPDHPERNLALPKGIYLLTSGQDAAQHSIKIIITR
jgi:hypothetical protein